MRQPTKSLALAASAVVAALLTSACGGGGASPPPSTTSSFGWVVDGYLSDATVVCDSNGNGIQDAGEASTKTGTDGLFRFTPGCAAGLIASGGQNSFGSTKVDFKGFLRAPAGSTVVTPLTSLLAAGMSDVQVKTLLGIPAGTDLRNTDPALVLNGGLVEADLMKKTLAVQQLVQKTTEAVAALAGVSSDALLQVVYKNVVTALATTAANGPGTPLVVGTAVNQTLLTSLVKAAATAPGVAIPNVNPEAFATVIAGGLKSQAETLLKASNGALSGTTQTLQGNTQITTFIQANVAQLAAAPTANTTALGTSLTNQVVASTAAAAAPGSTGTCAAGSCIDFSGATAGFLAFGDNGGGFAAISEDPLDTTNKVAKIVKKPGDLTFLGAQVFTDASVTPGVFSPAVALTSTNNTITLRVYSPAIGEKIRLKVEKGINAAGDQEIEVLSTKANAWETLSFTFPNAGTYNGIDILPGFGSTVTADKTFYFDELKLPAPSP
jgi:hypothetical protein